MAKLGFHVASMGLKVASANEILLAFGFGAYNQLYRILSTAGDIGLTDCETMDPIEIPEVGLPLTLDQMTARFQMEGGVVAYGKTEFTFSLYDNEHSDSIYTVKRRATISGGCIGGVNTLSTLRMINPKGRIGLPYGTAEAALMVLLHFKPPIPPKEVPAGSGSFPDYCGPISCNFDGAGGNYSAPKGR